MNISKRFHLIKFSQTFSEKTIQIYNGKYITQV